MKKKRVLAALMAAITLVSSAGGSLVPSYEAQAAPVVTQADENDELRLWYTSEAPDTYDGWMTQSLPLGNSSIGASVFGGVGTERIQLTEKSLWSGGPSANRSTTSSATYGNLEDRGRNGELVKEIQAAFAAGDTNLAKRLCDQLVGVSSDNGVNGYGYFLSYGNMYLDFKDDSGAAMTAAQASDYVRDLDLNTAIAGVEYTYGGVGYTRENFVSYPDNVLVTKITADTAGKLNLDVRVETEKDAGDGPNTNNTYGRTDETTVSGGRITIAGQLTDNQMRYHSQTQVIAEGGQRTDGDGKVSVSGANSVVIITSMGTDYKDEYPHYRNGMDDAALAAKIKETVDQAVAKGYDDLKEEHVEDYQSLFHRMSLDLGQVKSDRPTNQMLTAYNNGSLPEEQRRMLEVVLHQYGRYMTIASSRGDTLPSNLQGIWAGGNRSPWHADYHTNVNLQMNYWPTYSGNLAECAIPLINYIDSMREPGRVTAKIYNGVESGEGEENGFVFHTQCTPFGWTGPGWAFSWGWSPASVPWILQNCWEHYEYTEDLEYMEEKLYPMMKEAVKFYKAILIPDPTDPEGRLVSSPAYSPEHGPYTNGNTYEQTLVWQLLEDTIIAGKLVGEDEAVLADWQEIQDNLRGPIEIGESGQIKEWYHETVVNGPGLGGGFGHRHISHMLGLFPGDLISVDTPEWLEAAIVSMNNRTDSSTGWGMGQRINTWARIGDGNRTYKLIGDLFKSGMYSNLWDAHPPFQIDGNFGYTSGVNEMLMQSNMGYINLLPALPDVWDSGSVDGILARGNFELAYSWENKGLTALEVRSINGGKATLQHDGISFTKVTDSEGNVVDVTIEKANRISFETEAGEVYTVSQFREKQPAPTGLIAARTDAETVELLWDASEAEGVTYKVYRTISDGEAALIASGVEGNTYTDDQGAYDFLGDFVYYIVPVANGEDGTPSEEVTAVGSVMVDDRDSSVKYVGNWGDWGEAVNYNSTIKYLESPTGGETATLEFIGTGIQVIVCNATNRGKYSVTIDGVDKGEIDTYSATTERQKVGFTETGLDFGKHTIVLTVTNTKNQSATGTKVELDAFKIFYSRGIPAESVTVSSASGAKVIAAENGTLQMKAVVAPENATDQGVVWSVTNTSGGATEVATITEEGVLTAGNTSGTVRVHAANRSNPSASGYVDIVIAMPNSLAYQDVEDADSSNARNPLFNWTGSWGNPYTGEAAKHSGGTKTEVTSAGAAVEYSFTGKAIEVFVHKHSNFGAYKIYIDDVLQMNGTSETHPLNDKSNNPKESLYRWNGTTGTHKIKLESASNTSVNLDFFRVYNDQTGLAERAALLEEIAKHADKTERGYTAATWTPFKASYDSAVEEVNKAELNPTELTNKLNDLKAKAEALEAQDLPAIDVSGADLRAVSVEAESIHLAWNACEYTVKYEVFKDGTSLGMTTATNYRVEGLDPDTEYSFTVKAVDEQNQKFEFTMDPVRTKETADTEAPSAVSNLQVSAGTLTWDAASDNKGVTAYSVFVDGIRVYYGAETSCKLEDMEVGQMYAIRVVAEDAAGNTSVPVALNYLKEKEDEKPVAVDKPWIFTDVSDKDKSHWMYKAVRYVYNTTGKEGGSSLMGAVGGSTEFQHDRKLDRAMLATILHRWAGEPTGNYPNKFTDVKSGYYVTAVLWANSKGIVNGKGGSSVYAPTDNVTRAEIAKMLYLYGTNHLGLTLSNSGDLSKFADAKIVAGKWSEDFLKWATTAGIISGVTKDGKFYLAPNDPATRAQCAKMIQVFGEKFVDVLNK